MNEIENKLITLLGSEQLTKKELMTIGSDYYSQKQMKEALNFLIESGKIIIVDRKYLEVNQ